MTGYEIGLLSTALAFIAFALVVSLVIPRSRPTFPTPYLGIFIGVCALFFVAQMSAVVLLAEVGEEHEEVAHETEPGDTEPSPTVPPPTETEPTETETTETDDRAAQRPRRDRDDEPAAASGDPEAGRDIFADRRLQQCHTLADANATGTVGPNLDESQPSVRARRRSRHERRGRDASVRGSS